MRFYLDSRKHKTESLVKEELKDYQGPALLAYNDTQFTPKDWRGIQNFKQSEKKDDPIKIGKFGIGFNSVYHITGEHSLKCHESADDAMLLFLASVGFIRDVYKS